MLGLYGMWSCTFFGHRYADNKLKPHIDRIIEELITQKGVKLFYVGTHGEFDRMVWKVLKEKEKQHPIEVLLVLCYMPSPKTYFPTGTKTVLPDGIEKVYPKNAIIYRNKWMIDHSDYVVTYVEYDSAGAGRFKKLAEKKNKTVINISKEE